MGDQDEWKPELLTAALCMLGMAALVLVVHVSNLGLLSKIGVVVVLLVLWICYSIALRLPK